MDIKDILPIIQQGGLAGVTVLLVIAMYYLIKSQQEQISAMKTVVDSTKIYIEMFNAQKIKESVDIQIISETEKAVEKYLASQEFLDYIEPAVRKAMNELSNPE